MRKTAVAIAMFCSLAVLSVPTSAQEPMKPGLYEVTSSMTWQKSPFPPGMAMPPQAAAAFGGAPHTNQVCYTQEWINKYGPTSMQNGRQSGDCTMTNVSMGPTGMTATMSCSGHMTGTGEVKVDWSMGNAAKGKIHFSGNMQMGPNPTPVEWTNEFTSVYKGSDCGSVQPMPMPKD